MPKRFTANAEQSQEVTHQHAAYGVSCRDIMAFHIAFLLETMQLCTYKNLDYMKLQARTPQISQQE